MIIMKVFLPTKVHKYKNRYNMGKSNVNKSINVEEKIVERCFAHYLNPSITISMLGAKIGLSASDSVVLFERISSAMA